VYHALATNCNTSNANSCNSSDPEVAALRTQYGADLTGFIYDGSAGYCGVSNGSCCMTTIYSCALSNKSFPHEFGHNMGAGHDTAQSNSSGYAHGYINRAKRWRTIMAYPCSGVSGGCPRVDNFSSPLIQYEGDPMGTADREDNARRIRERSVTVSNRTPSKIPVNIHERVIRDSRPGFFLRGLSEGVVDLRVTRAERLAVAFFSLDGKKTQVAAGEFKAGDHRLTWRPESLSPGLNVLVIRGRSGYRTYKLMAMR
jgi:hypothetical protein